MLDLEKILKKLPRTSDEIIKRVIIMDNSVRLIFEDNNNLDNFINNHSIFFDNFILYKENNYLIIQDRSWF